MNLNKQPPRLEWLRIATPVSALDDECNNEISHRLRVAQRHSGTLASLAVWTRGILQHSDVSVVLMGVVIMLTIVGDNVNEFRLLHLLERCIIPLEREVDQRVGVRYLFVLSRELD